MKDWGIRRKVMFISVVPALMIAFFLGGFFIYNQYHNLALALDERGKSLVKQLAPASEFGVFSGNVQVLRSVSLSALEQADVEGIIILDAKGEILLAQGLVTSSFRLDNNNHISTYTSDENMRRVFYAPIYQSKLVAPNELDFVLSDENTQYVVTDKIVGWVIMEMSRADTIKKQKQAVLNSMSITLIILFLTWLVARVIGKSVTEPILNLTSTVKRIGEGELDTRIREYSGGELKTLQSGINAMTESLASAQTSLQEKIDAATVQLRDALVEVEKKNEALAVEQERAEEASRAKSQFLANMSHELRTPLNAVIGYSEMLIEEAEDEGFLNVIPDLEKINSAGRHLLVLINSVLDLSKIEAGKMDVYREEFNVAEIVNEVASTISPLIEKNTNKLETHVNADVKTLYSDVTKVKQMLFNLLSNSSKFTDHGTIRLQVSLCHEPKTDWCCFAIRDTGIGMNAEQVARLFEPFTQADVSTTKKYGGTGLGLTICKQFAELLGGSISVSSEEGSGTEFLVKLPLTQLADGEQNQVSIAEQVRFAHEVMETPDQPQTERRHYISRVLVVDDDAGMRNLLRRFLEKDGFEVLEAETGQQALDLIQSNRPDVVTLDIMMPGMDGWSVLKRIKESPEMCDIAVVILSALNERNIGFTIGASDYLTKPIDWTKLSEAIKRITRKSEQNKVLLVEDDDKTRELVRKMLEKKGYQVCEAENGQQGLERVQQENPDLIILDLMMPVMDGFEMMTQLRSMEAAEHIPVLIMTAADLTEDEKQFLEERVEKVLQKTGVEKEKLLQEVSNLIKQAKRSPDQS